MMGYRVLDRENYPRKQHFEYFNGMANPYVGVTVRVDVTEWVAAVKEKGLPFFLSFCYCVSRAANRVPEFRQRIAGGQILEYDNCRTSHTVALEDGTYCYCTLDASLPFEEYLPYAERAQEAARKKRSIEEEAGDSREFFFLSTVPWLSYTALVQPTPSPADSNPRITWGRFEEQGGRLLMPVSVLCHHALVDGLHIAWFYDCLNEELKVQPGKNTDEKQACVSGENQVE